MSPRTESQALVARLGNGVQFIHCDVTDIASLQKTIADIEAQAGPVSVLVNNAANDDRHRVEDVTPGVLGTAHRREPQAPVLRVAGRAGRA